jgi:hypothetical protein
MPSATPQFESKRSEIGELLYQFKYRGDRSGLGRDL